MGISKSRISLVACLVVLLVLGTDISFVYSLMWKERIKSLSCELAYGRRSDLFTQELNQIEDEIGSLFGHYFECDLIFLDEENKEDHTQQIYKGEIEQFDLLHTRILILYRSLEACENCFSHEIDQLKQWETRLLEIKVLTQSKWMERIKIERGNLRNIELM